jgi:hypothetical protein
MRDARVSPTAACKLRFFLYIIIKFENQVEAVST